ncbi:hypothetical protein MTX78_03415 [Hymenobacter tibetensis]|uniref:DUF4153 domain-containing protein n=1 Tax=Hymenobacter tibetensis TaxID=497967 RepID=A0ABY4D050_9BACT|nr:hypothetical protein [Hymenobacter tibetensis]UOG75647.1 hypothetical protein MTX78_03415 [Hymenobacter tibetensis]
MKAEVLNNLDNPRQLEKLYRENKVGFKREFNLVYPEIKENTVAKFWNERLNFENEGISWGSKNELLFVVIASCIAGLVAKFPQFLNINEEYFYPRNIAFIFFPLLVVYFNWKRNIQTNKIIVTALAILASIIYINLLPNNHKSDTLTLACIHLPLLLWAILGFSYVGGNLTSPQKRLDFLRYNGDLVVMTTIILIAGGLMSAITMGLFELIGLNIGKFYFEYIVVWGLAAAPIVGTYLVQTNPQLVSKVSPVIAKVFTPLVLTMLVIYLAAVVYTGKDPYNDREFLLIFNVLLIGVMAIVLFSIVETSKNSSNKIEVLMLLGLSTVTIVINSIALSAILFRISEWGITPNRLAVLGGNILILTNLLLVTYKLYKTVRNRNEIENVEISIVSFLPIYASWTTLVIFIFPLLFSFK